MIISIDETLISQTDQRHKSWGQRGKKLYFQHSQRLSQMSMIAGMSSSGDFFFTMNIGKNNS